MRKLGFVLAGLLVFGSAETAAAQQGPRIGYIDSQAILAEAPGAQEAQAEFDRQMERLSTEAETMQTELDNLIAEYQQQQATLLANVRQAREQEIMQRQQRYQLRLEEMDQELAQSRQSLIEPILNDMSATIEEMRLEGAYAFIFDVQGQTIVAADPSLDLTQEVLRRLREKAAGSTQP
ncbi:MAG: OmpH family outer membrane protein [Gemmatimonadota bacterium]